MKSFGFLILISLIAFALNYSREEQCITTKDGKMRCCWWNSNTCCEPNQLCKNAFRRCCKTYNIKGPKMIPNISKILFPKNKIE